MPVHARAYDRWDVPCCCRSFAHTYSITQLTCLASLTRQPNRSARMHELILFPFHSRTTEHHTPHLIINIHHAHACVDRTRPLRCCFLLRALAHPPPLFTCGASKRALHARVLSHHQFYFLCFYTRTHTHTHYLTGARTFRCDRCGRIRARRLYAIRLSMARYAMFMFMTCCGDCVVFFCIPCPVLSSIGSIRMYLYTYM